MNYTHNFQCHTKEQALTYLQKYGVAVLLNVLDPLTTKEYERDVWKTVRFIAKEADHGQEDIFVNFFRLHEEETPFISCGNIAYAQSIFNVKQDPRVVQAFADMYGKNYDKCFMIANCSGLIAAIPPEISGERYHSSDATMSINMPYRHSEHLNIEGQVNLTDICEGDSAFACFPGSHRYYEDFLRTFMTTAMPKSYKVYPEHMDWFINECNLRPVAVLAPKGSITFFDSRIACTDIMPTEHRQNMANRRLSVPIAMSPRSYNSLQNMNAAKRYFGRLVATKNIPHRTRALRYGYGSKKVNYIREPPKLTDLGKIIMAL